MAAEGFFFSFPYLKERRVSFVSKAEEAEGLRQCLDAVKVSVKFW
jgi:hypothetical protein